MTDKEDKTSLPLDSDKNLLILAAKAVGINHPGGEHSIFDDGRLWDCDKLRWWNSLTSNDDCFRMETALGIDVSWWGQYVSCNANSPTAHARELFADHNGDKDKARRYASTRAAALRQRSYELEGGRE